MKYRMLKADELSALEGDLKAFLIINGVDGSTWEKINNDEPEKAIKLVEMFSDNVLQIVYEKIEVVEFRSTNTCIVFLLEQEQMRLISLVTKPGSTVSLESPETIHDVLTNNLDQIDVFQSVKKYSSNRESEIHTLLEQGCVPSTIEFWVSLEKAFLD